MVQRKGIHFKSRRRTSVQRKLAAWTFVTKYLLLNITFKSISITVWTDYFP